jgi:hypothetical protein
VLDDEVGVDEIERAVVEGQRLAQVGGDEAVDDPVFAAGGLVEIDAHELRDPVAVGGQPRPSAATCLENAGARLEGLVEQTCLHSRMRGLERQRPRNLPRRKATGGTPT